MRNYILELPKYRLNLSFKLIKRRKPLVPEPLIPTHEIVTTKYKKGSIVARYFRHIFEHKNIGKVFGVIISTIALISAYFPPVQNVLAQGETEAVVIESQATILHTEKGTQFPTNPIRITQYYNFFHPGLDLDGVTGDSIKPIKKGKVSNVSRSKFSYGNSVIVDHGNGLTSLYAHLSKIEVEVDQEVTTDTELGKMGATGHAFGDHLHLEIMEKGKRINPLSVLPR